MLILIFTLEHSHLEHVAWFHSSNMNNSKMYQVTSIKHSNSDLILHINMTIIAWLVPQLNASTSFFTLARFFGRQAVACPSPLLSTSKPFLAIFTISSHLVLNHPFMYCYLFHFNLASFKYETNPYAIPYVSLINYYRACFHIDHWNPTINKPLHEFHLHCCLVLELDCLCNNTSFLALYNFIKYLWDNQFPV